MQILLLLYETSSSGLVSGLALFPPSVDQRMKGRTCVVGRGVEEIFCVRFDLFGDAHLLDMPIDFVDNNVHRVNFGRNYGTVFVLKLKKERKKEKIAWSFCLVVLQLRS